MAILAVERVNLPISEWKYSSTARKACSEAASRLLSSFSSAVI